MPAIVQPDPSRPAAEAAPGPLVPPTVTPPALPLGPLRFILRFARNPLLTLPAAVYREPVLRLEALGRTTAWICDPAIIETILLREADRFPKAPLEKRAFGAALGNGILTAQGDDWRWQRRMAAPAFRAADLAAHVPEMAAAAHAQLDRWRTVPTGAACEIERDMSLATFDVLMRTIFAGATETEKDAVLAAGRAFLDKITWEIGFGIMHVPDWVWHPGKRQMRDAARAMRSTVAGLLARRRAEGGARDDLLARLLAARHPDSGAPLSDDEIVDNLATFLIAGHETTAKALTWTLYLLALAPQWQQCVRDEVATVVGAGPIEARHIEALVVTRQVVSEAMRLYPPVPVISRMAAEAVDLGGVKLPRGGLAIFPIYAIHRHATLWAEPDRFDPERFAPGREEARHRAQFMPFGFGPRVCIGQAFAMLEAMTLLAVFVRGARFAWAGRHVPTPVSRVTLRPDGGMPLSVTPLAPAGG